MQLTKEEATFLLNFLTETIGHLDKKDFIIMKEIIKKLRIKRDDDRIVYNVGGTD